MKQHSIQQLPLETLKVAPYNPRTITKEALAGLTSSLETFGLVQPIVWNQRTGHVVGGHQRVQVLEKAGEKTAQVVVVDLDEPSEKALNVALNSPTISGRFTDDLQTLLNELRERLPHDFMDLRFDELWTDLGTLPTGREDDVPDLPKTPVTQRGDLWKLGDHQLLCGDATSEKELAKFPNRSFDWMWTDPPYGVNYVGKTKRALTIENDRSDNLVSFLDRSFAVVNDKLSNGAPIYIAHPAGALSVTFDNAFIKIGWHFHETIIWVKSSVVLGHSDYQFRHEPILYGWKGSPRKWYGGRTQTSILEFERPVRSSVHPTMKPVALIVKCLSNSSMKNSVGYDPFLGSGSTLIACEQAHRRCMGVEIDPRYCDVIVERWESFSGGKAKRL